jgi:hypothetical protein
VKHRTTVTVTVDGFRVAGCARRVWERETGRRACPLCRREVRAIVQVVERDGNVVRYSDSTPPHPGHILSLTSLRARVWGVGAEAPTSAGAWIRHGGEGLIEPTRILVMGEVGHGVGGC